MTNHVYMIIGTSKCEFSDILRDLKKYTSKKIKEAIINNPYESRKE